MRRYAKDMAMLAEARRQMEEQLRKEFPKATPTEIRRAAKACVLAAYREMKIKAGE